jgi:hypothetical protein
MPADHTTIGFILDAVERLFGKVGAAILIACTIFFTLPNSWMRAIGIDSGDSSMRKTAGVLLLLSGAACIVAFLIYLRPVWAYLGEDTADRFAYRRIPLDARVFLGSYARFSQESAIVPLDLEAVQTLIDNGLMIGNRRDNGLVVMLSTKGIDFVRQNRERLRLDANRNPHLVEFQANKILVFKQISI